MQSAINDFSGSYSVLKLEPTANNNLLGKNSIGFPGKGQQLLKTIGGLAFEQKLCAQVHLS